MNVFSDEDLKQLVIAISHYQCATKRETEALLARLEAAEKFADGFSKIDYFLRHHSYCSIFDEKACNCVIAELKIKFEAWRKAAGK